MRYLRPRLLLALPLALAGLVSGIGAMPAAHADYGQGAQYQIEISYNCNNAAACTPVIGGTAGLWLWIELNANGTGDYEGSDCLHGLPAVHDSGDVAWSDAGGTLVISGLYLADGHLPGVITVPDATGHYALSGYPLGGTSLPGFSQVQVAP